ncbi:hypothetical protein TRFO_17555 [Tritrichomonas foetus]|uniref:Protein kinase domain-containing protein n=1 Tax=Tritrichomonas foetus TaxID=1144522 RepID=A0A1J4KNN3_9EUKA|nr:hypothetical protein TRFO_17555 [Tritrichomonas foetus]|eukprot:OHT12520.1 hypothetical protein TRFO_17555 [Tritrichomonas foetus]
MSSRHSQNEIPESLLSYIVSGDDFSFIQQLSGEDDEIWLANEKINGQTCLVKRLMIEHIKEEQKHHFYQEVIALSRVHNIFVSNFIGFTVQYPYCIFTEYQENSSLYHLLHLSNKEKLSGTHLTIIAMGIACGMAKLHEQRITESSLCSSNIYLTPEYLPKICHFNTSPKQIKWRAPEILTGPYDYKSDVFAYALILYELLTRKDPFNSMPRDKAIQMICLEKKRPQIPSDTPEYLTNLIRLCWNNNPERRPNFSEIYDSFESGEIHFPGTDKKAITALTQRVRNSERSSANSMYQQIQSRRTTTLNIQKQAPQLSLSPKPSRTQGRLSSTRRSDSARQRRLHMSRDNDSFMPMNTPPPYREYNGNRSFNNPNSHNRSVQNQSSDEIEETPTSNFENNSRNNYGGGLDLKVFTNYNDPKFYSSLNEITETLQPSQFHHFFKVISKYFSSDCPIDVTSSILEAISQLFFNMDAVSVFIHMNLHRFLPYDEPTLISSTFNVLYCIFDTFPEVFQHDYASTMSVLITKDCEKSLTLLSLFAKAFNELDDPWPLLDLLITYEKVYFKSAVGAEYISLLFFLNFTYTTFYQSRIANCRPIFVHFLNSTDKYAVQTSYKAICALYDDLYQIPKERLISDICDNEMYLSAISLLLRMKDVEPAAEIIYPLIHIAGTHIEATLLLLKMLKNPEAAKIMLLKPHWLFKTLPTIQDTLRLFLSVMIHSSMREFISNLDALPEFLTSLMRSNDKACVICLGSIVKRLKLSQNILPKLVRLQFFTAVLESFVVFKEEIVTALTLNVLAHLASIGYANEYLMFTDRLKSYIWSQDVRVSRGAFLALYAMSFFPQCAMKYRELRIDKDVSEIFVRENEQKRVRIFLKNVENSTIY